MAVLADGAGSAKYAETGAETVVQVVLDCLLASLSEAGTIPLIDKLRDAVEAARTAVVRLAQEQGVSSREFASTLLAFAASDTNAVCAHIGDGLIAVSDGGDEWSWVFWPDRGEYANTTTFLTDDNALEVIRIEELKNSVTDVALMSDGLEPLAITYATQVVHSPFFNRLFRPLHNSDAFGLDLRINKLLADLLGSEQVTSRVDDDLSIVIATRRARVPKSQ